MGPTAAFVNLDLVLAASFNFCSEDACLPGGGRVRVCEVGLFVLLVLGVVWAPLPRQLMALWLFPCREKKIRCVGGGHLLVPGGATSHRPAEWRGPCCRPGQPFSAGESISFLSGMIQCSFARAQDGHCKGVFVP